MPRGAVGAAASDDRAEEAATLVLRRGGSAIDGCIAGYFVGAAIHAGVLFGSSMLLVSGPGVGAHVYDGSVLQPGTGAPRPRGFLGDDALPPAARVGVSSAIASLAAAHVHDGRIDLSELAAPAARIAVSSGLHARASLLRSVGRVGASATRDASLVKGVLDVAGRAVGGNVTPADFENASSLVVPPSNQAGVLCIPTVDSPPEDVDLGAFVVCACDVRGVLAVLICVHDRSGVPVPSHEISVPRLAIPVRRGVPRLAPGARLTLPAPIAILTSPHDVPTVAVAVETVHAIPWDQLLAVEALSLEQNLRQLVRECQVPLESAVALARGDQVRAIRVRRADLLS